MSKRIGLDIGHGEDTFDNGSKGVRVNGVGYEEHHFNSAVALQAEARLKEHGFEVVKAQAPFQRDVPLVNRTNFYNAQKVDLIVSVHANAGVPSANGTGVFHWTGNVQGKRFADRFMENFNEMVKGVGVWGVNNGVWASKLNDWTNFHMLRVPNQQSIPAVLLELGFMTNANDFEYIFGDKKATYILECSEAIVKTVCDHYGVTYKVPSNDAKVPTPASPTGDYKIKSGDTFYSIASAYKVSVQDLQRANPNVNHRALQIGTYLVIPKKEAPKPQANMTTDSIVTYLNSIGVDSSFGNRSKLAVQYGISGYTGTATQNTLLLSRMRTNWKPAPKGDQKTDSIVTYLNSIGVNSSFGNREKLAKQHGISNYSGTAAQNLLLLKKLRGH